MSKEKLEKLEKILKVIEETFDSEVYSDCCETSLGLESRVNGKEEFLDGLKEKLSELLK